MSFLCYASVSAGVVFRNMTYVKLFVVCISSFYLIPTEFPFVVQRSHSNAIYIAVQVGRVADFQLMVWAINADATRRHSSWCVWDDRGLIATIRLMPIPTTFQKPTAFVRACITILHWVEVHVPRQYSWPLNCTIFAVTASGYCDMCPLDRTDFTFCYVGYAAVKLRMFSRINVQIWRRKVGLAFWSLFWRRCACWR